MTQTQLKWKKANHQGDAPMITASHQMESSDAPQATDLKRTFRAEIFEDAKRKWLLSTFATGYKLTSAEQFDTLEQAANQAEQNLEKELEKFQNQVKRHRAQAQTQANNHARQSGELDQFLSTLS